MYPLAGEVLLLLVPDELLDAADNDVDVDDDVAAELLACVTPDEAIDCIGMSNLRLRPRNLLSTFIIDMGNS